MQVWVRDILGDNWECNPKIGTWQNLCQDKCITLYKSMQQIRQKKSKPLYAQL